jgi:hypothetical protein
VGPSGTPAGVRFEKSEFNVLTVYSAYCDVACADEWYEESWGNSFETLS